jgi:hypothetical protein
MIVHDGRAENPGAPKIQLPAVYPRWSGRYNLPDLNVTLEGEN